MKKIEEVLSIIESTVDDMKKQLHMIPLSESPLKEVEIEGKVLVKSKGFTSPMVLALLTGIFFGVFIFIACMIYT